MQPAHAQLQERRVGRHADLQGPGDDRGLGEDVVSLSHSLDHWILPSTYVRTVKEKLA